MKRLLLCVMSLTTTDYKRYLAVVQKVECVVPRESHLQDAVSVLKTVPR